MGSSGTRILSVEVSDSPSLLTPALDNSGSSAAKVLHVIADLLSLFTVSSQRFRFYCEILRESGTAGRGREGDGVGAMESKGTPQASTTSFLSVPSICAQAAMPHTNSTTGCHYEYTLTILFRRNLTPITVIETLPHMLRSSLSQRRHAF